MTYVLRSSAVTCPLGQDRKRSGLRQKSRVLLGMTLGEVHYERTIQLEKRIAPLLAALVAGVRARRWQGRIQAAGCRSSLRDGLVGCRCSDVVPRVVEMRGDRSGCFGVIRKSVCTQQEPLVTVTKRFWRDAE